VSAIFRFRKGYNILSTLDFCAVIILANAKASIQMSTVQCYFRLPPVVFDAELFPDKTR